MAPYAFDGSFPDVYLQRMMARLTGEEDQSFILEPVCYEFANVDNESDANWLVVRVDVADGPKRWSATGPYFLTSEVTCFIDWLRNLANAGPDVSTYFGTIEPNFQCEAIGDGEETYLRLLFSHEFHPDWSAWRGSGRHYDLDDAALELRPGKQQILRFADQLEAELMPFPSRSFESEASQGDAP